MNTLGELLDEGTALLAEKLVPHPRRDALLLLGKALGREAWWVLAHPEEIVDDSAVELFRRDVDLRCHRIPLQYIRGFHEFWGLKIYVGPGVLVPRPETEHLVEEALKLIDGLPRPAILEAGTGSGCVLKALAEERPDARLVGIDRSPDALPWAMRNVGARKNCLVVRADFQNTPPVKNIDLLCSNPPYIADDEWDGLPPEIKDFEPPGALRCGGDPLEPYRSLARFALACLRPGGFLTAELGVAQAKRARALRTIHPDFEWVRGVRDYGRRLRVAIWKKKSDQ